MNSKKIVRTVLVYEKVYSLFNTYDLSIGFS